MEFKLSEARVWELARIEEEAGCEVQAGDGWDHELARSWMANQRRKHPHFRL